MCHWHVSITCKLGINPTESIKHFRILLSVCAVCNANKITLHSNVLFFLMKLGDNVTAKKVETFHTLL